MLLIGGALLQIMMVVQDPETKKAVSFYWLI